jgi:hypothetical protein
MKKTNDEIAIEIYSKMYAKAKPRANFKKLLKEGKTKKPEWFMKYYLAQEVCDKIIEEVLIKNKVNKRLWNKWRTEILLGAAPTSIK